jgi:hypothetical protein
MGGSHNEAVLGVRATRDDREAAKAALKEKRWNLQEFVTACLRAVVADPATLLTLLEAHRPAAKPVGRPRKATPPAE